MSERDRAFDGSPRNRRPRDELGRPLPYGSVGVPTTPDDLALSPSAALQRADALLQSGRPFHAHEILELQWKACPAEQRALWQALAQWAVAITHHARGNPTGARSVLNRASNTLATHQGPVPAGLDLTAVLAWCREALATGAASSDADATWPPLPALWRASTN